MRQTKSLLPPSVLPRSAGLGRLLAVPAGRWLFPTLSLRVLPWMPGPLTRRLAGCSCPFLPQRHRSSPRGDFGSAATTVRSATSERAPFSHRLPFLTRSGLQVCLPPWSLLLLRLKVRRAAGAFTSEQYTRCYLRMLRLCLPPETGQLTAGDFHPIKLAALSAAPAPSGLRMSLIEMTFLSELDSRNRKIYFPEMIRPQPVEGNPKLPPGWLGLDRVGWRPTGQKRMC